MIIVFGSNVLDIFFQQSDLPPKDTALFLETHQEAPGGKGANQAVAAVRAGSEVRFYGALGEGGHGRHMYKNLAKCGVDVAGVEFLDVPSGLAAIFVDKEDGTHRIVVSQGANLKSRQDSIPDKFLNQNTLVLVQGELPMQQTETLIKRAKERGARTVMNFAPATQKVAPEMLRNLDFIILNEYEADSLGKMLEMPTSNKASFAQNIYKNFDLITIITFGGKGSIMACGEGVFMSSPLSINPIDTVGAGDAYTGYFCSALDKGLSLLDAIRWASVAGSITCTKIGAQTALPYKEEVEQYLENITISHIEADRFSEWFS
jgi:ribokinase